MSRRNPTSHVDESLIDSSVMEDTPNYISSRLKGSHQSSVTLSSRSDLATSDHVINETTVSNSDIESNETTLAADHEETHGMSSPVRQLKSYPTRHGNQNRSLSEISLETSSTEITVKKGKTRTEHLDEFPTKSFSEIGTSSSEITDTQKPKRIGRPPKKSSMEIEASQLTNKKDKTTATQGRATQGRGKSSSVVTRNLRKRNTKT